MSKQYVISVDFDGCLCTNEFPEIGEPIWEVIDEVKAAQAKGTKIILWTCRVGANLRKAVDWCWERGLIFDAVNENIPEIIEAFGGDCRKIFCNEYWDDRAVKMPGRKAKDDLLMSLFIDIAEIEQAIANIELVPNAKNALITNKKYLEYIYKEVLKI